MAKSAFAARHSARRLLKSSVWFRTNALPTIVHDAKSENAMVKLTRDSVRLRFSEIDYEKEMAKSAKQSKAEEDAIIKEIQTWGARYEKWRSSLSPLDRYRHERERLLVSVLRCRTRIEFYRQTGEDLWDFIINKENGILKRRQLALLNWRRFLITGIIPSDEMQ